MRFEYGIDKQYDCQPLFSRPAFALLRVLAFFRGDIFSQAFKMLKLGTLVGKRTWGGVIGLNDRRTFVDQRLATQPEVAFWFPDPGWNVENHGVDPDIEVELDPASIVAGRDPQLDKAIEVGLAELKKNPVNPPVFEPPPIKAPR